MRRRIIRIIAWLSLAALGLGVGMAGYLHVRYSPRCTIFAAGSVLHVSNDGEWLLMIPEDHGFRAEAVHVWNARTGKVAATYVSDRPRNWQLSPNGQWLVGSPLAEKMQITEWRSSVTKQVAVGEAAELFEVFGSWCTVNAGGGAWLLIDLQTGDIKHRFPAASWVQSRGDHRLLVSSADDVQLWDLTTLHNDVRLPVGSQQIWYPLRGRWLATYASAADAWTVWNLKSFKKAEHLPTLPGFPHFSADGERIACLKDGRNKQPDELVVFETASGRTLFQGAVPRKALQPHFSVDDRLVFVTCDPPSPHSMMVDLHTGKLIWEEPSNGWFLPHKNLVLPSQGPGAIRDARTGQALLQCERAEFRDERFIVVGSKMTPSDSRWSWLGKLLPAAFGEGDVLRIYETDKLGELYTVRCPSPYPDWWISKDGNVFVTQQPFGGPRDAPISRLDVWETSPWRARVVAASSAIATMLAGLCLSWWRRRRYAVT